MTGALLAVVAALFFGFSNVIARMGIARSSVYVSVTWNVLTNAVSFAVAIATTYAVDPAVFAHIEPRPLLYFVAAGLLIDFAGRTSLYSASARLGASRASAFRVAAPLVTVALGLAVLGEHLSLKSGAGVLLMLLGIAVVTWEATRLTEVDPALTKGEVATEGVAVALKSGSTSDKSEITAEQFRIRKGLVWGMGAALFFGLGDVFRKQGMETVPFALLGAGISSWTGLALYTVLGIYRGTWRHVVHPGRAFPFIFGAGLFTSAAVFCFLSSMRFIPVSIATPINGTQALFAILFGWLLNRKTERVTWLLFAGSFLAILGLTFVIWG